MVTQEQVVAMTTTEMIDDPTELIRTRASDITKFPQPN